MTGTKPELTRWQQFENIMFAGSMLIISLAAVQWILTTWYAQWKHARRKGKKFRPQMPKKITTFIQGGVPASDGILLRQWGISNQMWTLFWVVDEQLGVGLERTILITSNQFDMADAILNQNGAMIVSAPGSLRQYKFDNPWGVGAKSRSFDEGINNFIGDVLGAKHHGVKNGRKQAKLGKTYK